MLDKKHSEGASCETTPGLMPLDAAVSLAWGQVKPLETGETLPLADACGRIAAQDIAAPAAMPFFDNSAMDGFALRLSDLAATDTLPIAGTVPAGVAPGALPPGVAMRIFTGAPIPEGADAVAMVENCTEAGDTVRFDAVPKFGANIRRAGSDQPEGARLVARGEALAPRHIGLLAANGITAVTVATRPRVGVFSTGDELAEGQRRPGAIHDANRPMLLALARAAGAEATDLGILPDDLAATIRAFRGLGDRFDLVLTSGAVSVGGRDHVRDALVAAGGTLDGWRVAIKPGKPVAFGRIGETAITGLPGNPFAAFVGFHLFAGPQIARLAGQAPRAFAATPARAGFEWVRKPGRAEAFPVRLMGHDDHGAPILDRLGKSVSATLFPLAEADGLAMVPAGIAHVAPGDALAWQPFCQQGGAI
jgi:molybdopterin molybdotransferase